MTNARYSFAGVVEDNHLSLLSEEQLRQVLDATGCPWSSAKQNVAYDDHFEKLLITQSGRIEHYAGLDYCRDSIVIETPEFILYDVAGKTSDESQAVIFLEAIEAVANHTHEAVVEDDLPSP